jgi:hypothetical protein
MIVPGDEVRITAPDLFAEQVRGQVQFLRPDTLLLSLKGQETGPVTVPLESVKSIEVARGNSQLIGTYFGLLIGIAGGAAVGNALVPDDSGQLLLILGGVAGAAVGGFIGYQLGRGFDKLVFGMKWQDVPVSRIRWESRGFANAAAPLGGSLDISVSVFH